MRFPVEVIGHAVWLCHCLSLSPRDVELILAARSLRLGRPFANALKRQRQRQRPGGKWHLHEVFICSLGRLHRLWRAVDQQGIVFDILMQSPRNAGAAKRFYRKLLHGLTTFRA